MYQPVWAIFASDWLNGTVYEAVCVHWLRMMRSEGTERFHQVQHEYRNFVRSEEPSQSQIYAGYVMACIVNKL